MMKLRFFALAALFVAIMPLKLAAQDFATSRHYWEDGKLTWDDYLSERPQNNDAPVCLTLSYGARKENVKKGSTTYSYVRYYSYVDRYELWAADSVRTDELLLYHQTLFDISELYCRKATREYNTMSFTGDGDELFAFYYRQRAKQIDELNQKTDSGRVYLALMDYHYYIKGELEKENFDPRSADFIPSHESGVGMYIGYSLRLPIRGEFSPTHGMTLGWDFPDFPAYRSMLGLSMSLEAFGRSNVFLHTKNGPIYRNEKISSGSFDVYYAYNLLRTNSHSLHSFVAGGLSFYDGEKYDDGLGHKISNEVTAFTLEAGLIADIFFASQVNVYAGGRTDTSFTSLRLRPYLSFAHMKQGLGWMPSLNLSVSFCFSSNSAGW